jgi:hypothetical protein
VGGCRLRRSGLRRPLHVDRARHQSEGRCLTGRPLRWTRSTG